MNLQYHYDLLLKFLKDTVNSNYVYLDVPGYFNVGDNIICLGSLELLKQIPFNCDYVSTVGNFSQEKIKASTCIIMQGGGNFGDLWRKHQDLRQTVVEAYPDNKIIILPQTIFYKDKKWFEKDATALNKHKNLHICARDTKSLEILESAVTCNLHLVPDMAFYISEKLLKRHSLKENGRALFLKRDDAELCEYDFNAYITEEKALLDTCDWPTMEQSFFAKELLDKLVFRRKRLKRIPDIYADLIFRPFQVKKGVEFVSQYKKVYTTRLHVAILSILLKKEVVFFDNSYGKNSSFYHTWLQNLDNLKFIQ